MRTTVMRTACAAVIWTACGGSDDPRDDKKPTSDAPAVVRHLSPGADLAGPIAPPPTAGTGAMPDRPVAPLDLGRDRPPLRLPIPTLDPGGSADIAAPGGATGWVTRIPESTQLPAAAFGDGRIYITGGFSSYSFYALAAETGRIEWSATGLDDNGPTAAVYDDGEVLFNTESCTLFALDARTGKKLWSRWLGDPTLAQVAVAGGRVFAAHPSQDGDSMLSAFRTRDGGRLWSRRVGGELLAAPVVAGGAVYASTIHGVTIRFDAASGRRAWSQRLGATTAPWIAGDRLFVTRRRGKSEDQIVVSAASGVILAEHHHLDGGRQAADVPVNLDSWPRVWAFEGSRPVVLDGVRYVAMAGELRATDATSGAPLWARRFAAAPLRRSLGAVALAGPAVVVATRDGQIYGMDVDTGYTLWAYDLDQPVVAQPIIAGGWVYATTARGYVVGLRVADPTLDGWHMFGGSPGHSGPAT
jgi:Ca-activated chloride channel family protein